MAELTEVIEVLAGLCEDGAVSKGVKEALQEINTGFACAAPEEISMKVDAALGKLEDLSIDPNLSADVRTRLWNLTCILETLQNGKK
ncbi:MAG TPA: hypothetical protein HA224_01450 [Nanoarchaeota archaeon]|nr:hypothetical protein [Nanoarchaeota archaeon]